MLDAVAVLLQSSAAVAATLPEGVFLPSWVIGLFLTVGLALAGTFGTVAALIWKQSAKEATRDANIASIAASIAVVPALVTRTTVVESKVEELEEERKARVQAALSVAARH